MDSTCFAYIDAFTLMNSLWRRRKEGRINIKWKRSQILLHVRLKIDTFLYTLVPTPYWSINVNMMGERTPASPITTLGTVIGLFHFVRHSTETAWPGDFIFTYFQVCYMLTVFKDTSPVKKEAVNPFCRCNSFITETRVVICVTPCQYE